MTYVMHHNVILDAGDAGANSSYCTPLTVLYDAQQYWRGREKWSYVPVSQLADNFKASQAGQQIQAALAPPYQEHPRSQEALVTTPFALTGLLAVMSAPSQHQISISEQQQHA